MTSKISNSASFNVHKLKFNIVNMEAPVSHDKTRLFKPDKLKPPRDFNLPSLLSNSFKTGKTKPLVLEIGAGKGMHAYNYAIENPNHDVIAIERTTNKFKAFEELIRNSNTDKELVNNLEAVHADAIPYVVFAIPPKYLEKIFILYPNPEPKNLNQQWLNMPFFEFLLSRLKPNGKVILVSNIKSYIENAYEQATETWKLKTSLKEVDKDSRRTHFEIKYLARGETCWQLDMIKPQDYVTRFDEYHSAYLLEAE